MYSTLSTYSTVYSVQYIYIQYTVHVQYIQYICMGHALGHAGVEFSPGELTAVYIQTLYTGTVPVYTERVREREREMQYSKSYHRPSCYILQKKGWLKNIPLLINGRYSTHRKVQYIVQETGRAEPPFSRCNRLIEQCQKGNRHGNLPHSTVSQGLSPVQEFSVSGRQHRSRA